ncbi:hypothetical protein BGX29_008231 [Mortierella sp. GBA35]|nr:hypothetical protein BGX29_008231 [Mortierella sp. GBA35]
MASNTMNFGPEWMRRFPARTSQSQPDLLARAPSPPPATPPLQDWGQPAPSAPQTAMPAFSYSSIAASNVRSHNGAPGSDTSASDTAVGGNSNSNGASFASDSLNPFKYSKELMLALYRPTGLPIEFERHEYMTSEESLAPMSTLPFSDHEIKLLSGNVNSEVARRTAQPGDNPLERPQGQRRESFSNSGDNSGRYDRSLDRSSSYSRNYDSKGHTTGIRPRTLNSDSRSHSFRRTEQVVVVEREREPEEDGLWNSPVGNAVGSFDANGVFRVTGVEGEELQPLAELEESPAAPSDGEAAGASPIEDDDFSGARTAIHHPIQAKEASFSDQGSEKPDVVLPVQSQQTAEFTGPIDHHGFSTTLLPDESAESFATRDLDEFPSFGAKQTLNAQLPPAPVSEPAFQALPAEMSKWLYRDPSGSIQGPFLSDDMHEWYKGGFFTSDLLVKREQDSTFEPLGSLIRRVGSDDQPFLTAGVIRPEPPQPPVQLNRPSIPSLAQNRQPISQLPQSPGWMGMSAPSTPSTATFGADRLMLQQQQVQQQHSSGDLFSSTNGLGQQRPVFGGAQDQSVLSGLDSRWSSAQFSRPQLAESIAGWGGDAFSRSPVASMAAAHTPLGSAHYMEQQQRLHNQELERQQYMQLLQRQAQMQTIMHQQQFMAARQQFGTDPQALAALLAQQQAQQRQLQMRYQQLQFTGFHAQGPSTPGGTPVPWGGMGQPSSPWTTSIIPSNADNYFDINKGEGNQTPHSMRQQPTAMQPHQLHQQQQQHQQQHQQQQQSFQPFQQDHAQFHLGRPSEPSMHASQTSQPLAQDPQQLRHQQQNQQYQHQAVHDHAVNDVVGGMDSLQMFEHADAKEDAGQAEQKEQTMPFVEHVQKVEEVKRPLEHVKAIQEDVKVEEQSEELGEKQDSVHEQVEHVECSQQDVKEESVQENESTAGPLDSEEEKEQKKDGEFEGQETAEDTISETTSSTAAEFPAASIKASPAPWAKPANVDDETMEKKGPSLREIQELEFKKAEAAKVERQAQLAAAAALSGNGVYDFTKGMSGAPAWSSSAPATPKKKTLKEIQEEEEATMKKARAPAKQAQTTGLTAIVTSNTGSVGKRYADTIGPKPTTVASSGPWNMSPISASRPASMTRSSAVFASNPSIHSPTTPHSKGSDNSWIEVGAKRESHPAPTTVSPAVNRTAVVTPAQKTVHLNEPRPPSEEFLRWCRQALKGLQGAVLEDLIQMLLSFPLNPDPSTVEIIQDSVYATSQSLNGRQFADEFIKRRKADAFPNGTPASMVSGQTPSAAPDSSFKVVSKKGKKKGTA